MGYTKKVLDDVRAQIAPEDLVLKEARERRDFVRQVAESFPGARRSFPSGSLAHGTANCPIRRVPGTHAAAGAITKKLNQHGIPARAARNTALADLAGDLPAVVLADLLGLSISAATNWANHTKRNWTDYIAIRTSDARHHPTDAAESSK